MANIYFGDGYSAVDGNWNNPANWYLSSAPIVSPGTCCGCPTYGPGTAAGRVPVAGDSVVILAKVTTGPTGGWSGALTISFANPLNTSGQLSAGTYGGAITSSGAISGGTYNGNVSGGAVSGGTFNGTVSVLSISNGTFALSVTSNAVSGGTFASAVSAGNVSGGTFNGALTVTGNLTGSPVINVSAVTLNPGTIATYNIVTMASLTINISPSSTPTFAGGTYGGNISIVRGGAEPPTPQTRSLTISGGTFNGSLSIGGPGAQTRTMTTSISGGVFNGLITAVPSRHEFGITGGTYNPPAVQAQAIKSGNFMTFAASAIPVDPGFQAGGGAFNPVIKLTGTSDDILGAGLQ